MIETDYTEYRHIHSLIKANEYEKAIRKSLDFLRSVAEKYMRLELYNDQEYDGDDFFTHSVEELLARTLRDDNVPVKIVYEAEDEMMDIEGMEAYCEYYLCSFEHVHEAVSYRLADENTYIAELDKQIARYARDYKRNIERDDFSDSLFLYQYEVLGKLLGKKIEYLKECDRGEECKNIFEEYKYVPAICSLKINELIEKELDDEALMEIDKSINAYGDDDYSNTKEWHLQKIGILKKRHDKKGIIDEYRKLFRQFLSEKRTYFEKLKELVPKNVWNEFVIRLFEDIPHVSDEECIEICDMIVAEKKYQCLLKILMSNVRSFDRVVIFKKYASYMNESDQATYTNRVIDDLRFRLSYAKSKSYGYIMADIKGLYACGEVAQRLVLDYITEIERDYSNRPALMRLLRT